MGRLSFLEVVALAMTIGHGGVGAVVAWRRPGNGVGWLLLAIGGITGATVGLDIAAQARVPGWEILAWVQSWSFYLAYPAAFSMLLLLFPTGRPASRRWAWLALAIAAAQVPRLVLAALGEGPVSGHMSGAPLGASGPFSVFHRTFLNSPAGEALDGVSWLLPAAGLAAAGVGLAMRWRSGGAVVRRQLGWLVLVALGAAVAFLVHFASDAWLGHALPDLGGWLLAGLLAVGIPAAIAIALFRHGLYDVDRLLSRSLAYGAVLAVLGGTYLGVVALFDAFLSRRLEAVSVVLATALIAILFAPVRDRLQATVDRLLFGPRPDPYDVLAQVALEVASAGGERPLLAAVAASIARTLAVPFVAIEAAGGESGSFGVRPPDVVTTALHHRGNAVGSMLLGPPGTLPRRRPERRLLADIAGQAAVAAHTVNLTTELRTSRSKIVAAREEERRRLRRDLHDSLGPALAALTLKAGAARAALEEDLPRALALLRDIERESQATTGDIRRIAHSLRPPALDELGLLGAIRLSVETSFDTSVNTVIRLPDALPVLPAEVEASVLRITGEALANVKKHARARNCWVELTVDRDLRLRVSDDGIGLRERGRAGVGLASMTERAAELGGRTEIQSGRDGGTEVCVSIPLASFNPA